MLKLLLSGILTLMISESSASTPLVQLAGSLPRQVLGWEVREEDRIYDEKTIFDYIDGSGEVYRAYNMRHCLSRVYARSDRADIVLDLFDMGTAADAFGVFTHDAEGDVIAIGQDGRWRNGWVNFWKDRFFVSITVQEESAVAFEAAKELGRQVAGRISQEGQRPGLLAHLPGRGVETETVRFLHNPIVLNYHFYVADENILNLSPSTDAVLAVYRRDGSEARLLIVQYPDAAEARKGASGLMKHYLADADPSGTARLENGKWASARTVGEKLVVVLEAGSRELAENLAQEVR